MSDKLTRYRRVGTPKRVRGRKVVDGFEYVPDSTLQDIADAYQAFKIKRQTPESADVSRATLFALLDGLVNDE